MGVKHEGEHEVRVKRRIFGLKPIDFYEAKNTIKNIEWRLFVYSRFEDPSMVSVRLRKTDGKNTKYNLNA